MSLDLDAIEKVFSCNDSEQMELNTGLLIGMVPALVARVRELEGASRHLAPFVEERRIVLIVDPDRLDRSLLVNGADICADVWFDGAGMVHALSGTVVEMEEGPGPDGTGNWPLDVAGEDSCPACSHNFEGAVINLATALRLRRGLEAILDAVGRAAPRGGGASCDSTQAMTIESKVRGLAKRALKEAKG